MVRSGWSLLTLSRFDLASAASLLTLRSGLPPIIISAGLHVTYRTALNEGMRMNTKPMVDLVAQALVGTVGEMVERVRSK